jgi:uncharacterized membrane protein
MDQEQTQAPKAPETGRPALVLPQPQEISQRDKDDAMAAYLMMFASWAVGLPLPLVNLIASVVYYGVSRKGSRFVGFHSLQSLLSQVPVSLLNAGVVGWLIGILATGFRFPPVFFAFLFFTVAVNIAYIVLSIIALVNANRGRFYYMPWFGRVAFARFYGPDADGTKKAADFRNLPPEGF